MNICIVTSWFPSKKSPNLAPFVFNTARNLGKISGASVSVIVPLEQGEENITRYDFMTVYRVKGKYPLLKVLKLIRRIKPDIIHVHAPNLFSSVTIIISKITHIPVIATVHRAEVDSVKFPLSVFRKFVLAKFQKVIASSKFAKSLAIKAGAHANNVSIIHNSCDESIFHYEKKNLARKRLNLQYDTKIILFVGNLIRLKGIYTLIESLKLLRDIFPTFLVLIIGKGEEQENLRVIVKKYGLEENVKFFGWLPQSDLPIFYNAADVFVLPSTVEGQSVAVLEAMASGLPIVASNIAGNRESIEDGVNGLLFESGSERSLAEKLGTLLSNSNLLENISITNPKTYEQKFSTRIQIEKHQMLYESVLNKRDKSAIILIDNAGLSHYTSYLALGLSKYRHILLYGFSKEDYITTGANEEKRITFYSIEKNMPKGNSIISLTILRPLHIFTILFRALILTKYDIVHIQGHLQTFYLFLPLLKVKSKHICWTLHDVDLRPSSSGIRGRLELIFVNTLTQPKVLAKYCDEIIVHGSILKKQLMLKGVKESKIHSIPHFDYNYLIQGPGYDNKLEIKDLASYKDYVLLFGRIKPYKGIGNLIEAARIVRKKINQSFMVLIAGKGDVSSIGTPLTEGDRYFIHIYNEFIPNAAIPQIFNNAKFLVLPYNDASQSGIVPLAYTFSKPIIASNVGSLAEFIEHGKTGFIFEQGNIQQLADYMIELIENENECIEMGKKGHAKAIQEMSLENCCEVINGLYQRD